MSFDFNSIITDKYFYSFRRGYNSILSNELSIISNNVLKNKLMYCYEVVYPSISFNGSFLPNIEQYYSRFYEENFIPTYYQNVYDSIPYNSLFSERSIVFKVISGYEPDDFKSLKKSSRFKFLLEQGLSYRKRKYYSHQNAWEKVNELIKEIDKELTEK